MRLILILARHYFCLPGIMSIENANLTDPTAIEKQLALGEHVKKGQPLRLLLLSVILPPVTSYHQLELIDSYISMWRHNINRGPHPNITQEIPAPPAFLLSGRSRSIDPTSSRKQGRSSTSAARRADRPFRWDDSGESIEPGGTSRRLWEQ